MTGNSMQRIFKEGNILARDFNRERYEIREKGRAGSPTYYGKSVLKCRLGFQPGQWRSEKATPTHVSMRYSRTFRTQENVLFASSEIPIPNPMDQPLLERRLVTAVGLTPSICKSTRHLGHHLRLITAVTNRRSGDLDLRIQIIKTLAFNEF